MGIFSKIVNSFTSSDTLSDTLTQESFTKENSQIEPVEVSKPSLRSQFATTILNKARSLTELDRKEEALATYDDLVQRFNESRDLSLRKAIVTALVEKGTILQADGRQEEALSTYRDLIHQFGNVESLTIREQVHKARTQIALILLQKGATLVKTGHKEEALAVYEEVIRTCDVIQNCSICNCKGAENCFLCEQLTKALIEKGGVLQANNQQKEALSVYEDVINKFGASQTPQLQEQVAKAQLHIAVALIKKANSLIESGYGKEALTV
ncbi:MAG: tetratricopeptide repeat protein [Acetobacter sp.]|nr:tetratricopeptide repeat protein [Acetobacter sp.]